MAIKMRAVRFIWALIKYLIWGDRVSTEVQQTRLSICYTCKDLCDTKCCVCGCYVKKKTQWSTEVCPKNKW